MDNKKQIINISFFLLCFAFFHFGCTSKKKVKNVNEVDVVLVGGGIMSATLGSMLRELDKKSSMAIFERLDSVAQESSAAFNNAGTGHSAFCELNYTPELEDGSIDIEKALKISESFEITRQFWAYSVMKKNLPNPRNFIRHVPHISFVMGKDNVSFLKKRYEALKRHTLFKNMQYSEKHDEIKSWIPLIMQGRDSGEKVAATKVNRGTDVNFGALTKGFFDSLKKKGNTDLYLKHEVIDFEREEDGKWLVIVKDLENDERKHFKAKFVFIGAGGYALPLLQKTGIPQGDKYAGFPVGGEWLVTENQELVNKHLAKVYGKAPIGSPPMSSPHLDTRHIGNKKYLLFGPFAVFSTKFLKHGSYTDIFASFRFHNAWPMLEAGWDNIPLTVYLVKQVLMNKKRRVEMLRRYFPNAKNKDWYAKRAGQRVQIIKDMKEKGGTLRFGTEIVSSDDDSMVALLGASPGASTAVQIAMDVIENSFSKKLKTPLWQKKMREMIPSYNRDLSQNEELFKRILKRTQKALKIK